MLYHHISEIGTELHPRQIQFQQAVQFRLKIKLILIGLSNVKSSCNDYIVERVCWSEWQTLMKTNPIVIKIIIVTFIF